MSVRRILAVAVSGVLLWGAAPASSQATDHGPTAAEATGAARMLVPTAVNTTRRVTDRLTDAFVPDVGGRFVSRCAFSHRRPDDPIVFPGRPGASHLHDFFGSVATDAHATAARLRAAETTCDEAGDTSAYWVPTLFADGEAVTPLRMSAYYTRGGKARSTIEPLPAGLQVIAGDARATQPQDMRVIRWACHDDALPGWTAEPTPPDCGDARTRAAIDFPDCWDGVSVTSADHRSHMAYSEWNGRRLSSCPSTHPVPVPQLRLVVAYDIPSGSQVALASGSLDTMHADFWNTWDQASSERFVRSCINANRHCELDR